MAIGRFLRHFSTNTRIPVQNVRLIYRAKRKPDSVCKAVKCDASSIVPTQCQASSIVPTQCFAEKSIGWVIADKLCIISGAGGVASLIYYYVMDTVNRERAENEERRLRKKEEMEKLKLENEKNHKDAMEAIALLNKRRWFIW